MNTIICLYLQSAMEATAESIEKQEDDDEK